MARYIDAERVPNDKFWEDLTDKEKAKVLSWFLQAPTADVIEVVRCEDCKYASNNCAYGLVCTHKIGMSGSFVAETDFCSCGERKE